MSLSTDPAPSTSTLVTSQEVRDRGSTFVACIHRATTVSEAKAAQNNPRNPSLQRQPAPRTTRGEGGHATQHSALNPDTRDDVPYAIAAWRCMVVKPGRTGLGGPDEFELSEGWEDGGEKGAGRRVLGGMQREGVLDAVVVVRRWFGGTLLGPVRFTHIEACASEVCRRFRKVEEMEECVHSLNTLDGVLDALRTQLAAVRGQTGMQDQSSSHAESDSTRGKRKVPSYRTMQETLDLPKAKRLIHARECAISNTKVLIEKYRLHVEG